MRDNEEFSFDIDSILAEFNSFDAERRDEPPISQAPAYTPEPPAPVSAEKEPTQGGSRKSRPQQEVSRPEQMPDRKPRRRELPAEPEKILTEPEKRPHPGKKPLTKLGIVLRALLGCVFAVLSAGILCWMFLNVHPNVGVVAARKADTQLDMVQRIDSFANNAASDALSELVFIPKIYTIPESATVAPAPDPARFGSTTDPKDIQAVINSAAHLLDGQETVWDESVNFISGSAINWYLDDTILVITWQEDIDGKCCTCAEVKIADGSQIRRKIAGDSYSLGVRFNATDMAKECNSVVAINGDFYDYRTIGVTVYQRQIYRFKPDKLDSCHFNSNGDMIFSYAGTLTDEDSTRQFIADNDILFTLSFGPVLVDNGEIVPVTSYPIGEIDHTYSRTAIGQLGDKHYFLMTINYADGYKVTTTVAKMGEIMYRKGCEKAYELDGGQTSVIVLNGELVNHVDWGDERTMSDLIYFATAVPEDER